jgi:hypothetical protein
LRHHGLCLTKGRRIPTHKGSNMPDGQYAHPGETTKEKSHALSNSCCHQGVMMQGTSNM